MRRLTGFHAVEELLKSERSGLEGRILVTGDGPRIRSILGLAEKRGIAVSRRSREELDRLAPDNRGIVLELDQAPAELEGDLEGFLASLDAEAPALVVVLDHLEDPQNVGAILRSADIFAADLVLVPRRRSAPLSSAVSRASAGALAYVPVATVPNLAASLKRLAAFGFWSYAADMGGSDITGADIPARSVLVFGNEGSGVSRLLREECDGTLSIRQAGHVDSLNVSAAAAIMMYEYRRRHPGTEE
ncbi:MAG TPA: 23S rRNA (guanosine(2251)-2'-O)-methyltransferase RlmB [Rectinemataceae bacterium]|nr:23S rRNA (guanosine(2251)-2'-O)-methyltransferase RlmB [Rectinemataceae bacterium]